MEILTNLNKKRDVHVGRIVYFCRRILNNKDMEKLIKILEKFDTLRDYFLNNEKEIKWDEAAVAEYLNLVRKRFFVVDIFLLMENTSSIWAVLNYIITKKEKMGG